jgi:hypothetical protein
MARSDAHFSRTAGNMIQRPHERVDRLVPARERIDPLACRKLVRESVARLDVLDPKREHRQPLLARERQLLLDFVAIVCGIGEYEHHRS